MDLGNLQLKLVNTPLVGFGGSEVLSKGTIDLPIAIREEPTRRICMIQFLVVDSPFAYNVVVGQPGLNMFQVVVSTYYVKMKFSTKGGIGELKCDQREARRCYNLSMKNPDAEKIIEKIKVGEQGGGNKELKKMKRERIEPIEGHKDRVATGRTRKTTRIGSQMTPELETLTIEFLKKNNDMFAWSPLYFQEIDPKIIVHRLNVDPLVKPIK
ncbi:hypothetical protein Sango_2979600 [Sesamum angolense]|uniref:Uncharacterized protein n=1 Tax=Sesamum angolense TaxID=2727404 RepID=A0AAE1T3V5_9LAMI|nr:hypothetical protein Sango_2979600 [Sesamum angolense]